MQVILGILILIVVGIFWLFSTISEEIQKSKNKAEYKKKLDEKYKDRTIDYSKSLEERNEDIIKNHLKKLSAGYHRSYYIENSVRDCIQEIAESERKLDIAPNYSYLSTWERTAPPDWLKLKDSLLSRFRFYHQELEGKEEQKKKDKIHSNLENLKTRYQDWIKQFYEVAERKVSVIDEYGQENWNAFTKELDSFIKKIALKEKHSEDDLKKWKKYDWYMPEEFQMLKKNLESNFKSFHQRQKNNKLNVEDFNKMSGVDFEVYLANLLKSKGYSDVSGTPATGDQGADLIAKKGGKIYIIQAKRYEGAVGNGAVQEVASAVKFYSGDEGWVITNSIFTKSAKELAQKVGVRLIDGHALESFS